MFLLCINYIILDVVVNVKPYLYFLHFLGASYMAQLSDVVEHYIR